MTKRTGACMCGAVAYEAGLTGKYAVCYCEMCQRWASGMFTGVETTSFEVTKGADVMTVFRSSDWASRAFCSKCGSNIYYHSDASGAPRVTLGSLDDQSGLENKIRFFSDKVPAGLALKGDVHSMTEAECMAAFGEEA